MIVEKTVIRDEKSRVSKIVERTLSPREELAELVYAKVEGFSRDSAKHAQADEKRTVIISIAASSLPAWGDPVTLLADIAERAKRDTDMWSRTRWAGLTLCVE